ncbi:MAG: dTDP-glucose 4,6-dehydratase, partial [Gammaproteobacteria bacterium]
PYQFPEKLIPLIVLNALEGRPIPVYGDGRNVRDWLYVGDHCAAIGEVLQKGRPGEVYNIGGNCEKTNLDVIRSVCAILDELRPDSTHAPHAELIAFVEDRPGHDRRYAIDTGKIRREIGWTPHETFSTGLRKTVAWYLDHREWLGHVADGSYKHWIRTHYGENA